MRPAYDQIAHVWRAYSQIRHSRDPKDRESFQHMERLVQQRIQAFYYGQHQPELDEEVKRCMPDAWWRQLIVRCPRCGANGERVTEEFEAPPQDDVKAWKRLQIWVQSGADLRAQKEKYEERTQESCRHYRRSPEGPVRETERTKRIETLKQATRLGIRTSEEERRLAVIRARKGKDMDAWAVIIGCNV